MEFHARSRLWHPTKKPARLSSERGSVQAAYLFLTCTELRNGVTTLNVAFAN